MVSVQSKTAKYNFPYTLPASLNTGDTAWVDDQIRSRFFTTSYCGLWVTSDALDQAVIPRWYKLSTSMTGIPYSVANTTDGDTLYVGTSTGKVYKFPNFNVHCDTITYPVGTGATAGILYKNGSSFSVSTVGSRAIEGISVDPYDNNHVVAVNSGFSTNNSPHVYETTNGGTTWTPLVTGLPNMPVYDVEKLNLRKGAPCGRQKEK